MFHKNPHISHHYKATTLSSFYSVLEGYTPYGKPVVGWQKNLKYLKGVAIQ